MPGKNSHCSYCGQPFPSDLPFPRRCTACGHYSYLNPLPVSVLLQPVGAGLLTVRRSIAPGKGMLALPGGFIEVGETWQSAAARELQEETGMTADPNGIQLFDARSAPDGTLLIFGLAATVPPPLPPFAATQEASELVVIHQPKQLAFPLHTRVVADYFARLGENS